MGGGLASKRMRLTSPAGTPDTAPVSTGAVVVSTMGGVVDTAAGSPVVAGAWSAAEEAVDAPADGDDWEGGAGGESPEPAGADPGAAAP